MTCVNHILTKGNVLSSGVILYYGFCSDSLVLLFLLPGVSVLFPLRV